MYLLPSEIFLTLYVLIPMSLVVYRWQHPVGRVTLTMACAAASWLFFNACMVINPPDSGFGGLVYFVTGWFWMLPLFGILLGIDFIIHLIWMKFVPTLPRERLGRVFFRGVAAVSILVAFWGLVGQMSKERAIVEAGRELSDQGYQIVGPADAEFAEGHWIVRYPESEFIEICLNRNGSMHWIGGPG